MSSYKETPRPKNFIKRTYANAFPIELLNKENHDEKDSYYEKYFDNYNIKYYDSKSAIGTLLKKCAIIDHNTEIIKTEKYIYIHKIIFSIYTKIPNEDIGDIEREIAKKITEN